MAKTPDRDVPLLSDEFIVTVRDAVFRIRLGQDKEIVVDEVRHTVDFAALGDDSYSLILDDHSFVLHHNNDLERIGQYSLSINGHSYAVSVEDRRSQLEKSVNANRGHTQSSQIVCAPMPGLVARVEVGLKTQVVVGQGLVVLEAMKMENEIKSVVGGVVAAVHVSPGKVVEKGEPLVTIKQN